MPSAAGNRPLGPDSPKNAAGTSTNDMNRVIAQRRRQRISLIETERLGFLIKLPAR
jgi:hypothetical protein